MHDTEIEESIIIDNQDHDRIFKTFLQHAEKDIQVFDLTRVSDARLQKLMKLGPLLLSLKHCYDQDFLPIFKLVINGTRRWSEVMLSNYFEPLLTYVLQRASFNDKKKY